MLTLPAFEYHAPTTVEEAVQLLAEFSGDVKVLAGGTDLLPNMKHRLFTPKHVVALKNVAGLSAVREENGYLRLGAMLTLDRLAEHPLVQRHAPSLARAAEAVAGPQLRRMGTLGGNVCLDTRCVYYNQTYFWRKALGYCLKKDGTVCHVVKGGQRCVAAASNDTAPVLMTLGATVLLLGPAGIRELRLDDFYTSNGANNTVLAPNELLVEVKVPLPTAGSGRRVVGHEKLRMRAAIDYPVLAVAVAAQLDAEDRVEWVRVAVSALGARPQLLKKAEAFKGRKLDAALVAELGQAAYKQCHPLDNINVDPAWRRELLPVLVRKAFAQQLA